MKLTINNFNLIGEQVKIGKQVKVVSPGRWYNNAFGTITNLATFNINSLCTVKLKNSDYELIVDVDNLEDADG